MGEPLCTYKLYDMFKATPLTGDPVPHLKKTCQELPLLY